eukprot:365081-Chlamydomonas_euryale.AAC.5
MREVYAARGNWCPLLHAPSVHAPSAHARARWCSLQVHIDVHADTIAGTSTALIHVWCGLDQPLRRDRRDGLHLIPAVVVLLHAVEHNARRRDAEQHAAAVYAQACAAVAGRQRPHEAVHMDARVGVRGQWVVPACAARRKRRGGGSGRGVLAEVGVGGSQAAACLGASQHE